MNLKGLAFNFYALNMVSLLPGENLIPYFLRSQSQKVDYFAQGEVAWLGFPVASKTARQDCQKVFQARLNGDCSNLILWKASLPMPGGDV